MWWVVGLYPKPNGVDWVLSSVFGKSTAQKRAGRDLNTHSHPSLSLGLLAAFKYA
jgi:hypothetical protein